MYKIYVDSLTSVIKNKFSSFFIVGCVFLMGMMPGESFGQTTVTWAGTTSPGNGVVSPVNANISPTAVTKGTQLSGTPTFSVADGYGTLGKNNPSSTEGWNETNLTNAVNSYVEYAVTLNCNVAYSITGISFTTKTSAGTITTANSDVRYSTNGFTTFTSLGGFPVTAGTSSQLESYTPTINNLQNKTIQFRIYGANIGNRLNILNILNFQLTGNVITPSITTSTTQSSCSGFATAIALTGNPVGATFSWTLGTVTNTSGASAGSGSNIAQILTSTGSPSSVQYNVSSLLNGCTILASIINTVNKPTANAITGSAAVCIGSTISLSSNATGTAPLTYTFASSNTGVATVTNAGVVTGVAAGTTNITYTVTDGNGCSTTSAAFLVTVTKPTAGNITAAQATVCIGSTLSLASNASGVGTLTYTWASSTPATATVSTTGVVTGVAAGTTNITYTVTDGNGCSTTSAAFLVTVTKPTAGNITGASTVCIGSTINLSSAAASGTGPLTFTWASSTPATATVTATGVVTGVATGTTNITYTVTDGNGCSTTSATFLVTVTKPTAGNITGASTVCIGSTINLSSSAASGTGPLTFTWASSTPATATVSATGVVTGVATGTTNITYIVTDGNGCSTTSATFLVTVTKPIAGNITGASAVCIGSTINLSSAAASGTGPLTFTWASSTPATATVSATGVVTGVATGTTNITYIVTDGNGCSTTSATFLVTVTKPIAGNITGASAVCIGSTINLSSAAASGTGPLTFTWASSTPATATVNATGVVTGVATGTTNITYTVTDGNGCSNTSAAFVVTVTKATANPITGSSDVCIGATINLSSNASGVAPLTYTFASSNTAVATVTNAGVVTGVAVGTTNITYTVTDGNGCSTTSAAFVVTVTKPTANAITGSSDVCIGATINLSSNASGVAPLTYTFASSNAGVATVTNAGVVSGVAAGTTNITYTVTDGNGCSTTSAAFVVTVTKPTAGNITGAAAVCIGSTINLASNASGVGTLTYTFASSNTGVATVTNTGVVSGVATGTTNITYTVTDGNGCSATSAVFTVTVDQPVAITTQPVSTSACSNSTVTFTVAASGSGTLTYQWLFNGTTLSNGPRVAGATTSTLTLSLVNAASGGDYKVRVTDAGACTGTTSSIAVLTITQPVLISTQPAPSQTLCEGVNVNFTTIAQGTGPFVIKWFKGATEIIPGGRFSIVTTVDNSTSPPTVTTTLSISNIIPGDASNNYYAVINPVGPCADAVSNDADLNVNINSTISLSSAGGTDAQTKCINTALINITYAIGGGGTGASITAGVFPTGVTGSYSGGVYTISGTPTVSGSFSYTITTSGPCVNNSLNGTIDVNANSTITLSSAPATTSQSICINTALTPITYTIAGSGTGASITAGALPTGVTGSFSAGVFTISGTPSVSGNFSYTITTAGPCVNNSLSGTITVNANSTISLSSAAGTDAQTKCINTALTNITYAIGGGGTGASITAGAFPTGVTGGYSAGVFTISGTSTVSGSFSYTVTTQGPCVNNSLSGTITVNANSTITLSSAPATTSQSICINTALTPITYTIAGSGTGASITAGALPTGVTGSFSAGVFTISGTPTVSGNFSYTITTAGPCVNNSLSGTITVNANSTISLSSAGGTDAQTKCINTALTPITYAIGGGGTGASITAGALPGGVTGSYSGGVYTISGTPTASGSYSYTVTTQGPCVNNSLSGTITVNANSTINLSSAPATTSQSICINTALTPITYTIGGGGTGASITAGALPGGVTGSYSAGLFTISGTPTASGSFSYTVTTAGPCVNNSLSGTITVNANSTISLSSAGGTDAQTKCINTALTPITYAIGGGGTGASITAGALPGGVTGSNSGGVYTISGTPTASGSFSYTITTAGPCVNNSMSGTITVNANSTINLSSAAGTNAQTKCINTALTNITYAIGGGGTGASITAGAFPAGVTGNYSGGVYTISGTPTVSGSFSYTITTAGPCVNNSLSGTITVNANSTITLSSAAATASQTICINTAVTAITYTIGGSGTGATVTGLPTGITGAYNAGVFTISGTPTVSGSFTYSVTTAGPCVNSSLGGTITVSPGSVGGVLTIRSNGLTVITHCPNAASGIIDLTGQTGDVKRWQSSVDGGRNWNSIANTNLISSYSYTVTATTLFRAVIQSIPCDSIFSAYALVSYIPPFTANPVIATPSAICLGDTSILTAGTGFNQWGTAIDGTFNQANPDGWDIRINGVLQNNFPANGNNTTTSEWSESNGPKTFNSVQYDNGNVPGTGKFAVCLGLINTTMESPVFSTIGMPSASFTFWQALTFNAGTVGKVEVSVDGGANYIAPPLAQYNGATTVGVPLNGWVSTTFNLNNYLGQNNVRIRFNYSGTAGSVWAIDALTVPSAPPAVTYTWSPTTGVIGSSTTSPISVSPTVTTTYTISTTVGGCVNASSVPVTVTVNPLASITLTNTSPQVCANPAAQTTTIPYNNASASPNKYSIAWSATPANSFVAVTNATLNPGSITINIPANTLPGTYRGKLTVKNNFGCSAPGDSISIIVNARPTAALSDSKVICSGGSATLTFTVTGTGPISGTLSGGIAFSGTAPTITVTVSPAVTTTYTIATLTNGTCSSLLPADATGVLTVTVNTPPAISLQPTASPICVGSPTTITAGGSGSGITYQWQVSTDGGSTYTDLTNGGSYSAVSAGTININPVTIAMVDYLYRLKAIAGAPCNTFAASTGIKLKLKNVWIGPVSTDWHNGANWSDGNEGSVACADVHILGARSFQPTLGTGVATITNLIIYPDAILTVDNANMQIAGTISNLGAGANRGVFIASKGTVEMNGNAGVAQTIPALTFQNNALLNLIVNNPTGLSLGGTLDIYRSVTYANTGRSLTTGDFLTLKSTATETAWLGNTTGNTISGAATIERYLFAQKSWRFLAAPVTAGSSPSVFNSWQEGGNFVSTGYGVQITGPAGGSGLDATTQRGSLKSYDMPTNTFIEVTNTGNPIYKPQGYMVFVRGDRSVVVGGTTGPTNLRIKGLVNTGPQTFTVGPNLFESFGNPYPSRIDFRTVSKTTIANQFTVWNPFSAGSYNLGAYETYVWDGSADYRRIPGNTIGNFIESGQAVFLQNNDLSSSGSVTVKETDKANGSSPVNFTGGVTNAEPTIDINLYTNDITGNRFLADGVMLNFSDSYSAAVNNMDVKKSMNVNDNLAITQGVNKLIVERHPLLQATDTIFLNLTNTRVAAYRFEVDPSNLNFPGLEAFIKDKFTATETPVSLTSTTAVPFDITSDAASKAADRFLIFFKPRIIIPFAFTGISAERNPDKTVTVKWKVENETGIANEEIENSTDGSHFNRIGSKVPNNTGGAASYEYHHDNAGFSANYYRIKSMDANGVYTYSDVAKVAALVTLDEISISPNPIEDKALKIAFNDILPGKYRVEILNAAGTQVYKSTFQNNGRGQTFIIHLKELSAGSYRTVIRGQKTYTGSFIIP